MNSQRAARLVQYHAENEANPGLAEVIATLLKSTWQKPDPPGLAGEVARTTKHVVLVHLLGLAADASASTEVRSIAIAEIANVKTALHGDRPDPYAAQLIAAFERDPKELQLPKLEEPPPGQPIGDEDPDGNQSWN